MALQVQTQGGDRDPTDLTEMTDEEFRRSLRQVEADRAIITIDAVHKENVSPSIAARAADTAAAAAFSPLGALRSASSLASAADRGGLRRRLENAPVLSSFVSQDPMRAARIADSTEAMAELERLIGSQRQLRGGSGGSFMWEVGGEFFDVPRGLGAGATQTIGTGLAGAGRLLAGADNAARWADDYILTPTSEALASSLELLLGEERMESMAESRSLQALTRVRETLLDTAEEVTNVVGETFVEAGEPIKDLSDFMAPDEMGFEDMIYQGIGQMASAVGLSYIGGAGLTTATFASMGADMQAERLERAGIDPLSPEGYRAMVMGASVTALSEQIRLGRMVDALPPNLRNSMLARLLQKSGLLGMVGRAAGEGVEESIQEAVEGILHNMIATSYEEDTALFSGLLEEMSVAGISAFLFQMAMESIVPGRARATRSSEGLQEGLRMMREAVESIPAVQHSRATVSNFINEAAEADTVNLSAEAIVEMLARDDGREILATVGVTDDAIAAAHLGTDARITVGDLTTSDQYDALVRHVRVSAEDMTLAEVESGVLSEALNIDTAEIARQIAEDIKNNEDVSAIEEAINRQVQAAGRSAEESEAASVVWGAAMRGLSDLTGRPASEIFENFNIAIQRGRATANSAQTRQQAAIRIGSRRPNARAKNFLREALRGGMTNPLNDREAIVAGGGIEMSPSNNRTPEAHIYSLRALVRGGGRNALQRIINAADRYGVDLTLFAQPFDAGPNAVEMSQQDLIKWYESFGFKDEGDGAMRRAARPTATLNVGLKIGNGERVNEEGGADNGAGGVRAGQAEAGVSEGSQSTTPLDGAPKVKGFHGPDPSLVSVAEKYAEENGIPLLRQAEYVEVDEEFSARIAEAYEAMEHNPDDPAVAEAYADLIEQVSAQYDALVAAGYKFWFVDPQSREGQDYLSSPWNAMRDIRANKSMGVYPTEDGYGNETQGDISGHPLMSETNYTWPVGSPDGEATMAVTANDLFRAVHDAFGHGLEGSGFRAQGEENAWQAHARLFKGAALGALTSETRGQNSWLNYGPHGEQNRNAQIEDTIFADQKAGLMPSWTWTENVAADQVGDGVLTEDDIIKNLPSDVSVVESEVLEEGDALDEPTFVAQLSRPLTNQEVFELARATRQQAIAQATADTGFLEGPGASDWGDFNPRFFHFMSGQSAFNAFNLTGTRDILADFIRREDGRLPLIHYAEEVFDEIDVDRQGSGLDMMTKPIRERKMKRGFLPRAYLGIGVGRPDGYSKELNLGDITLQTDVDPDTIYPVDVDPLMLQYQARDEFPSDVGRARNRYEELIREAGYTGYFHTTRFGPVLVTFENLSVTPVASRTYNQSGTPLLSDVLVPRGSGSGKNGKVKISDIGQAMTDQHMKMFGRKLFPESSEEDFSEALAYGEEELASQLAQPNSGVGWYDENTAEAIRATAELYPTLLENKDHRDLYLTFAAIFSNGKDPDQAWVLAGEAFNYFIETGGEVPVERRTPDGEPVGISKQTGEPTGWSQRNAQNVQHLRFINFLIIREKGLRGALDWMTSRHSREDINEAMVAAGIHKKGRYVTRAAVEGPPAWGFFAFGPKLGPYAMSLYGVDVTADETVIDLWYTRTFRRWTGRLMDPPIGNEGVAAQPASDAEREAIFRMTEALADKFDMEARDIQAVLWFFEKRVWRNQGVTVSDGTNLNGAISLLEKNGITYDAGRGDGQDSSVTFNQEELLRSGDEPVALGEELTPLQGYESREGYDGSMESVVAPEDIKMPISEGAPNDVIRAEIAALTEENKPIVAALMADIDATFGTRSGDNVKDLAKVIQKANRPSIITKKPWYTAAHIRDSYRFKTEISDLNDVPAMFEKALARGIQVVKIDTEKVFNPGMWGWRIAVFDLRMPNGQLVEWYLPITEMEQQKKAEGHDIFEQWRNKTDEQLRAQHKEYMAAIRRSYEGYERAFSAALDRLGLSVEDAAASWSRAVNSMVEAALNSSKSSTETISASVAGASLQSPGLTRTQSDPSGRNRRALPPPGSTSANNVDVILITSEEDLASQAENVKRKTGPLTFNQDQIERRTRRRGFTGAPTRFSRFDRKYIGSGEGAHVYGWGFYTAEAISVARMYYERYANNPDAALRRRGLPMPKEGDVGYDLVEEAIQFLTIPGGFFEGSWRHQKTVRGQGDNYAGNMFIYPDTPGKLYQDGVVEAYKAVESFIEERGLKVVDRMMPENSFLMSDRTRASFSVEDEGGDVFEIKISGSFQYSGRDNTVVEIMVLPAIPPSQAGLHETEFNDGPWLDWERPMREHDSDIASAILEGARKTRAALGTNVADNQSRIFWDAVINGIEDGKESGAAIYSRLRQALLSQQAASEWLYSVGITGVRYLDGFSRQKGEGTFNYVIFNEADIDVVDNTLRQEQDGDTTPNADVTFSLDGALVNLYDKADASSFLHESAHIFLEMYARLEGEYAEVAEVMEDVRAWLGINPGEQITRDQHERFARSFEVYLMEGKAPSAELRGPFAAFSKWFTEIYRDLKHKLPKLEPEARQIFDKMLAGDIAIAQQQRQSMLHLAQALEGIMTEEEIEKHSRLIQRAGDQANEDMLEKISEKIRRSNRGEVAAKRKKIKEEVTAEIDEDPVYVMIEMLTNGTGEQLNRNAVLEYLTEAQIKRLPKGRRGIVTDEGGIVDIDAFAVDNNFSGADGMLNRMVGMNGRRAEIVERTERRAEREGVALMTDMDVEAAAIASVYTTGSSERMAVELNALSRKAAVKGVPLAAIRKEAQKIIDETPIRDGIKPGRYAASSRSLYKKALRAAARGDFTTAVTAMRQALMQHELARIAYKTRDEIQRGNRRLARLRPNARKKIDGKTHAPEWVTPIWKMYALAGSDNSAQLAKDVMEFVDRATWNEGAKADQPEMSVVFPADLYAGQGLPAQRDMTVTQFREWRDALLQMNKLGRDVLSYRKGERAQQIFDDAVAIEENAGNKHAMDELNDREQKKNFFVRGGAQFFASLRRLPYLARILDGGPDATGRVYEWLIEPLRESSNRATNMKNANQDFMQEWFTKYSGILQFNKSFYSKTLGRDISGEEIFAILANSGNESNRARLISMPVRVGSVADLKDTPRFFLRGEEQLQEFIDEFGTAERMGAVQSLLDYIDTYWPMLSEVHRRTTGVTPPKVEAETITAQGKTYRGGYYPLAYDPLTPGADPKSGGTSDTQSNVRAYDDAKVSSGVLSMASTRQGHAQARAEGVQRRIDLRLDVATRHLDNVAHDIAFRENFTKIWQQLTATPTRLAIENAIGKENYTAMKTMVQRVVAGQNVPQGFFGKMLRGLRTRAVTAMLGVNMRVVLTQPLALTQSYAKLGTKQMTAAIAEFVSSPIDTIKVIKEKSTFMRNRDRTMTRDIKEALRENKKNTVTDKSIAASMWLMQKTDMYGAAAVTWLAAYRTKLDEGWTDRRAALFADTIVADTQGSGEEMDLSRMQSGEETGKMFSFMYGYFSGTFNLTVEALKNVKGGKVGKGLSQLFLIHVLQGSLAMLLMNGLPDDDDDDGDILDDYARAVAMGTLENMVGSVPMAREMSSAFRFGSGQETMYGSMTDQIARFARRGITTAEDFYEDGRIEAENLSKLTMDGLRLTGLATGLPTYQAARMMDATLIDETPSWYEIFVSGRDREDD